LRERGMNFSAQPLSKYEASIMRRDAAIRKRVIVSYKMMLDLYGMCLLDEELGTVGRNPKTWKKQLHEVNHSHHNYLRITRILKFLGAVGLEHYKFRFLNHVILEIFKSKKFENAESSCIRFWMPTLRKGEHLKTLDALCGKLGRKINRKGYDGVRYCLLCHSFIFFFWQSGDETEGNWATHYYKDDLAENGDHEASYTLQTEILVAEHDPYAECRPNQQQRRPIVPIVESNSPGMIISSTNMTSKSDDEEKLDENASPLVDDVQSKATGVIVVFSGLHSKTLPETIDAVIFQELGFLMIQCMFVLFL